MVKLTRWLKKRGWMVTCVVLVAVLLGVSGIQVIDRVDLGSRMGIGFDTSRTIGIGVGVDDKVITLGHIAYAAGNVDYTYDGTNDHIQFQLALNALPVTGGRLVDVSGVQKNFGATVTRAIPNVVIVGAGAGSYFTNNGVTSLFTAGGNGWKFQDLQTDAGGISMDATTRWNWENVTVASAYYAYRTPVATTGGASWEIPVGRSATYVVAASNAPAHVKAQADYVCDGTDDNVEIQVALNALPAGGGVVQLTAGTFTLSANIVAYGSYRTLQGTGSATIIKATTDVVVILSNYAVWRNLTFDGQSARSVRPYTNGTDWLMENITMLNSTQPAGFALATNVRGKIINSSFFPAGDSRALALTTNDTYVENVYINGVNSTTDGLVGINSPAISNVVFNGGTIKNSANGVAIYTAVDATNVKILNMTIDNTRNGIYNQANYGVTANNYLTNIGVANGIDTGLANYAVIMGNIINGIASTGINVAGNYVTVVGNTVNSATGSSGNGIVVESTGYTSIVGNTVTNNVQYGILVYGTVATNSKYNTIVGNTAKGNGYGIAETATYSDYNLIEGNTVYNNVIAQIQAPGPNTKVRNNIGYITENSGTATVANATTSIVVNHGLATTPTRVLLTARLWSNAAKAWVTNLTATQFTINVDADPGTGTAIFDWRAQIGEG